MRTVYILPSPFIYLGYTIGRNYVDCVSWKKRMCKINMNDS